MNIVKAIQFAATKHKGQVRRESGLPYVTHPIIVGQLINHYKGDSKNIESLQIAAILHDTLEDTKCDQFEIEREFGSMVASIVMELTNDEDRIKEIGKNEYLKEKMLTMSRYAFILKLVDRFANITDGPKIKYVANTLELMDFLKTNKHDLTDRHRRIIADIEKECREFLKKH